MKPKFILRILVICLTLLVSGQCSLLWAQSSNPIVVTFWTLPDPEPAAFWTEKAKEFMAENPNIKIDVAVTVEAPTTETVLLAAIAGGKAPTAAEGIVTGFAAQLAKGGAIVSLESLPGWEDMIKARNMGEAIKAWEFPDNHFYILPIYSNPMLFSWRVDFLTELGFGLPKTYSEIMAVASKFKEKYSDKFVIAYKRLGSSTWYYRWYDFFPLYYAASDGQPFLTGNKLTADNQAAVEVLKFFADLASKNYLLPRDVPDAFETGISIWRPLGPWELPRWTESFPELKYEQKFMVVPPPVPDRVGPIRNAKTFADAKGIVFLSQASVEERAAMWKFLKWVLSNSESDLKWAEMTGMLPVRDDLITNPNFVTFFNKHPELVPYAEEIPYAIPSLMNVQYNDIYLAIGEKGFVPVIKGEKTAEQAWQDVKQAIETILAKE